MARVYHRDQPGSPTLTYSSSATLQFSSFVAILKACLVTGFGTQPAAGWELIFENSGHLVLRNASHTGYICFGLVSNGVRISLAESFLGVSSGLIQGDGAKSGISADFSVPQILPIYRFTYSSTSSSWYVVADNRSFTLGLAANQSAGDMELLGTNGQNYSLTTFYAGDDSRGNFIACGGTNSTSTSVGLSGDWGEGFTALRNPDTGLLVDTGTLVRHLPGIYWGEANSFSRSLVLPEANLSKILWSGELGTMASFRGLALEPRTMAMHCSDSAQALGLGSPLMSRTAYASVNLGDGYSYLTSPRYRKYGPVFFVTDNPEFW